MIVAVHYVVAHAVVVEQVVYLAGPAQVHVCGVLPAVVVVIVVAAVIVVVVVVLGVVVLGVVVVPEDIVLGVVVVAVAALVAVEIAMALGDTTWV